MNYDIFQFGALCLDSKIQPIPQRPERDGDIPQYDGKATISIVSTNQEKSITWIKPNSLNLLIADRVLLNGVSWEDLDKNGFVKGEPILIDGQYFRCRLLQIGKDEYTLNEWDATLDETGKDNTLWHWNRMFFWGVDISAHNVSYRAVRGYSSAHTWAHDTTTSRGSSVGFRPALEPLPSNSPILNINLDEVNFQLASLPEENGFRPVLQPTQENVFGDIPVGGKVRMYTFLEGGKPIHFGATVKDISKLTLTDRYYGDEFLIPWVISNGIAIASQSMKQQI